MFTVLQPWFRAPGAVILLAFVALLVGIVLISIVHRLYFVTLPQWAIKKYKRIDPERLRRYLERVVATHSRWTSIGITRGWPANGFGKCRVVDPVADRASLPWRMRRGLTLF